MPRRLPVSGDRRGSGRSALEQLPADFAVRESLGMDIDVEVRRAVADFGEEGGVGKGDATARCAGIAGAWLDQKDHGRVGATRSPRMDMRKRRDPDAIDHDAETDGARAMER